MGAIVVKRTCPITLTEIGKLLCQHGELVQLLESDLFSLRVNSSLQRPDLTQSKIKIAIDDANLFSWFIEALAKEYTDGQQTCFEILLDESDHITDALMSGNVQVALSSDRDYIQGFETIHLGANVFRAIATPTFFRRHFPNGVTPEALARAPSVSHSSKDSLRREWVLRTFGANIVCCHHTIPSSYGCLMACQRGLTWGIVPSSMVDGLPSSGELIELVEGAELQTPLYWHYGLLIKNAISHLTHNVKVLAKQHLEQPSAATSPSDEELYNTTRSP